MRLADKAKIHARVSQKAPLFGKEDRQTEKRDRIFLKIRRVKSLARQKGIPKMRLEPKFLGKRNKLADKAKIHAVN